MARGIGAQRSLRVVPSGSIAGASVRGVIDAHGRVVALGVEIDGIGSSPGWSWCLATFPERPHLSPVSDGIVGIGSTTERAQ